MRNVLQNPDEAVARAVKFAQDPARLTVRQSGLLDAGMQESLQRYTRLAAKRFRLGDQLSDYWDGEPGAGSA